MNKAILYITPLILLILITRPTAAHDAELTLTTMDLPYTEQITLDVNGEINTTMNVTYDNWLSGQETITFEDPLYQLPVQVDIPEQTPPENYTRTITIEDNITLIHKTILIIIQEEETYPDSDNDGYTADVDCDDQDPEVNPGMPEVYYNGKDDDCNPNTEDDFIFWISLSHSTMDPGDDLSIEITAINQSNVTIEICEDGEGFMPCYYPITNPSQDYPYTLPIPYTNVSGNYLITGTMQYNQNVKTKEVYYTINNNIAIHIEGDTTVEKGERFELAAHVAGGMGEYTYLWTIPGGGTRNTPLINVTFAESGNKIINLKVTDEAGNQVSRNITIYVKREWNARVVVTDEITGAKLANAKVSVRDLEKTTNSNGATIFKIPEGTNTFTVIRNGYDIYTHSYTIDEDMNISISLIKSDENPPAITIISPKNGTHTEKGPIEFKYQVNDITRTTCDLYIGSSTNQFLQRKNTTNHNKSGSYGIGAELQTGEYSWKIECEDQKGNSASSKTFTLIVREEKPEQQEPDPLATIQEDKPDIITVFYDAQDRMKTFNQEQQTAAEALKMDWQLKDALRQIDRLNRDFSDLAQNTQLTEQEFEARNQELTEKFDSLFNTIPVNIIVHEHNTFVSYPTKEELLTFIDKYYKDDLPAEPSKLASYLTALQSKMKTSTTIMQATLYYADDSKQEITLLIKKPTLGNLTKNEILVEIIPQEYANKNEIVFVSDARQAEESIYQYLDPEEETQLVYYLKKRLQVEAGEHMHTVVVSKKISPQMLTTGNSIISIDTDLNSRAILIFLIIMIIGVFVTSHFDGFEKAKTLIAGSPDKNLHYIRVLINDALDNLQAGNYDNSRIIFNEIKLCYESLKPREQILVHSEISHVAQHMDIGYIKDIIDRCRHHLKNNENTLATQEYNRMQDVFESMPPQQQKKVFNEIIQLHNDIQHTFQ